jgi:hypothetical protein
MICAQMKPAVSGLEREYPGKVKARNVDATDPDARADIQSLGFKTHGLVIRSTDGKTLWKERDHTVRMEDVESALKQILGS